MTDDEHEAYYAAERAQLVAAELEAIPPHQIAALRSLRSIRHIVDLARALGLNPDTAQDWRSVWFACPLCSDAIVRAHVTDHGVTVEPCHNGDRPGEIATRLLMADPNPPTAPAETNGHLPAQGDAQRDLGTRSWADFAASTTGDVSMLVRPILPVSALIFLAAPPKAGKTWLALALGLCVAVGRPFLGSYPVTDPGHVLYVALEGQASAIKARVGCMARGLDLDPSDADQMRHLHVAYKPRGINLRDPQWAGALTRSAIDDLACKLVIIDVLRSAARIRESGEGAQDFAELAANLAPILDAGCSVVLVHHFTKWSPDTNERQAAERMSGSGALYGALDAALLITSAHGVQPMRVEHVARDLPEIKPIHVGLMGEGTGENGAYTYADTLRVLKVDAADPTASERASEKAHPQDIYEFLVECGGTASPKEIRDRFDIDDSTLRRRRRRLETLGVDYVDRKQNSYYCIREYVACLTPAHPGSPGIPASAEGTPAHPVSPRRGGQGSVPGSMPGSCPHPISEPDAGVNPGVDDLPWTPEPWQTGRDPIQ